MKQKTNFTLFLNIKKYNISPMRFYIYDCKEKKQLEKLINYRCGVLEAFPTKRSISLAPFHIKSKKYELFSTNFIFDCCKENKLLDLKLYRLSKNVKYAAIDPMSILKGQKLWPFKIFEDFNKNGSKTLKKNQIESSAPMANSNNRSSKMLGNQLSENQRFHNYPQLGSISRASSKSPGNTFVDNEMSISSQNCLYASEAENIESLDLLKHRSKFSESNCTNSVNCLDASEAEKIKSIHLFEYIPQFSESNCTNSVNSKICTVPNFDSTNKRRGNYFSAFSNTEIGDKSNEIISNIENKSLKSQMKNEEHKCAKGYYPSLTESKMLKINKYNDKIKRGRNINSGNDNTEEEMRIKQSKRCNCHSSNISEQVLYNQMHSTTDQLEKERYSQTNCNRLSDKCHSSNISERVLYKQMHSATGQLEKEMYSQTYCNRLSDNVIGHFSTAHNTSSSKQSSGMKSKTNKSRHFVCSVACEHNLSGMMENLRTSFSPQRKCDKFTSGCKNSSMPTSTENSFHDFSSSFDEFSKSIFEQSSKCGDIAENIEESAPRFQWKTLPEQFDSDNVSNNSFNTPSWINNEEGVIEQTASSVTDNCVPIWEEKCKRFLDEHLSSVNTYNQEQNSTEILNVNMDNESVSFKTDNQFLNTENTVNYVSSPTDADLQVISAQPENYNIRGEETEISNEFGSMDNNTFTFSNEILSLIRETLTCHTKKACIPHHVKSKLIQRLFLEVWQRSYLSSFTVYDLICGSILCQPLLRLIREDLHNNKHNIFITDTEQNKISKSYNNDNLCNISPDLIIQEENIEVYHSEQPHMTKHTNYMSTFKKFPQVNSLLKSVETQETSESALLHPIIIKESEKNYTDGDNGKCDSKYSETPIYDDDDGALYTGNSCDSKGTTNTRKFPEFSENSDSEDVPLPNDEFMGNQYPLSEIISFVDKAFPNSQCETFDSDASSVSIHAESVKAKLEDTLKEATSYCETLDYEMKNNNNSDDGSFVPHIKETNRPNLIQKIPADNKSLDYEMKNNNSDDGSFVPRTKETNRPNLIQKITADNKLADSIVSKDNKIKWNGRENKNLGERKEINDLLPAEDCDQHNDSEYCSRFVDGLDSNKDINAVHDPLCASSQESSYFTGISPDVDLVVSYKQ